MNLHELCRFRIVIDQHQYQNTKVFFRQDDGTETLVPVFSFHYAQTPDKKLGQVPLITLKVPARIEILPFREE